MKVHIHADQFDGAWHPQCGRGDKAVNLEVFEATPEKDRCQFCDRYWFPCGQPDWHYEQAVKKLASLKGKA